VPRPLNAIIAEQERAFRDLLDAEREVEAMHRAGKELTPVDGQMSDIDRALERLHAAQHRLDALSAEAVDAATAQ
jgi:hypothetical protein